MTDIQFENIPFTSTQIAHDYGKNIHLLSDPALLLGLAKLSSPECHQPMIHSWVSRLYRSMLLHVLNEQFRRSEIRMLTRMHSQHPEGVFTGTVPDPNSKVVVVNVARAGTVPSFVCYDELNYFFEPNGVRQDHIILNRAVDDKAKVTGVDMFGAKIGGSIEDAYVLVPDPMGATGSTLIRAIEAYKKYGKARAWIAMHLIITPEYVQRMQKDCPELQVYALRLDRGLSSQSVLRTRPGSRAAEEKGLNSKDYIVPGAGGLGEILNNAFI